MKRKITFTLDVIDLSIEGPAEFFGALRVALDRALNGLGTVKTTTGRRGRPKKTTVVDNLEIVEGGSEPIKRGPGRPKKTAVVENLETEADAEPAVSVKRRPGRPAAVKGDGPIFS